MVMVVWLVMVSCGAAYLDVGAGFEDGIFADHFDGRLGKGV